MARAAGIEKAEFADLIGTTIETVFGSKSNRRHFAMPARVSTTGTMGIEVE